jgi:lambda family phage portal protein
MGIVARALRSVGLQRIRATSGGGYSAGGHSRLNADWAIAILSADQKIRASLTAMRARSRQLAENNDYAIRWLNLAKQNVIGPAGIGLEMSFEAEEFNGAPKLNDAIETAWNRWGERATADQRMSWTDAQQMWIHSFLQDGETFLRRVRGYPHNATQFALQFVDPDQVDTGYNRLRTPGTAGATANEIRMSVELDEWRRPVAYWINQGHPAEVGFRRVQEPADRIGHDFAFRALNQTRGVPWMHTAMTRLHMLGGYEEAELVAARLAACKMAAIQSKTGEDDGIAKPQKPGEDIEIDAEPGSFFRLPEGASINPVDWNHPSIAFKDFTKAMLRGVAVGLNVSYSSLTGDLSDVNFSSIRQGILDERDGWQVLQAFAVEHLHQPVFADFLVMALTTGQVQLPAGMGIADVLAAATWKPRGWQWVDPARDIAAQITARRAGNTTLAKMAAQCGDDWRDNIDQIAIENEYAKKKGVSLDFTTSGAGGVEGDTAAEELKGGTTSPAPAPRNKPNGKGALAGYAALDEQNLGARVE